MSLCENVVATNEEERERIAEREQFFSICRDTFNFDNNGDLIDWYGKIYKDGHFLAPSKDAPGKVAYSPKGVGPFDDKRRMKTTLGRYLSRIHNHSVDGCVMQAAIDKVMLPYKCGTEWVIARGKDLLHHYLKRTGTHSCMTDAENQEKLELYAHNPERVGLLVWRGTARALLWNADCGSLCLDRIYTDRPGAAKPAYAAWMKKNNAREVSSGKFDVTLKYSPEFFPYMDNFKFYCPDSRRLSNWNHSYEYFLECTDGGYESGDRVLCTDCESMYINLEDDECLELDSGEIICCRCSENYVYCDVCNLHRDVSGACSVGYDWVCESCFEDDFAHCYGCNCASRTEYMLSSIDGQYYCEGCYNERFASCEICDEQTYVEDVNDDGICVDCVKKASEETVSA